MELPDGWKAKSVGDLALVVTSGSRGWAPYYSEAGARFIRITNLSRGRTSIDLSEMKYVSLPDDSIEGRRTRLEPNDILISITADLGLVALVPYGLGEAYVNQHIALVRLDDEADPGYVARYLTGTNAQLEFQRTNDAGAKAGLNLPTIRTTPIVLPPLPEQRKIAAILSSVDEAIEKTQAVIDQVQVVKKGLMQELLTRGLPGRHTKFKQTEIGEIPASWEVVELRARAEFQTGYPFKSAEFSSHGYRLLRGSNVSPESVQWSDSNTAFFPEERGPEFCEYELSAGDIVVAMDRPFISTGFKAARIEADDLPALLLQRVGRFRNLTYLDQDYLWVLMRSQFIAEHLRVQQKGTDLPHISRAEMESTLVPIPELDEQRRIAAIIGSFDGHGRNLMKHLNALDQVKQALMSVLLTGELRVTP